MLALHRTGGPRDGWMALAFAALALFQCWPVVASGDRWGFWDWDVFQTLFEAGRVSVLRYGQLPGWTPWVHGGEPLDAHPLHSLASPVFLAVLVLGTVPALKLWVVLRAFAALFGSYLFGRRLGLSRMGSVTVALIFGLASTYALRVGHGHWNLQAAAYLPLLAHAALGAVEPNAWRDRILASVWLALMFLEGGPYAYAMGALVVVSMGLALLVRSGWRVIPVLACVGALSLGLSAVKLVPVFDAYSGGERDFAYGEEPGAMGDFYLKKFEATAAEILWQALLERDQAGHRDKKVMPFYINVGAYVGALGLVCVALGAVFGGPLGRVALLLALPFIWLVLGSAAPINLWALLHQLPGWSSMTLPSKFTACYLLAFAVAAGAGIDGLERCFGTSSRWRVALAALLLVLALDLLWVSRPIFAYAFPVEPIATEAGSFHQVKLSPYRGRVRLRADHQRRLPFRPGLTTHTLTSDIAGVRSNIGTLVTYTGQPFPVMARPDTGDSLGLEQLRAGDGAPPRLAHWSPNELRIEVDPKRGGQLVVNQNFNRAWRASGDGRPLEVRAHGGRLEAGLPPGVREVVFRYRSASVRVGAAVSAVSLGLLVLAWLRWVGIQGRDRRARDARRRDE
jgi:hypothetical protein